ncbi:hypothetical protein H2201_006911 [Coniosporium apollinis]|uniref:Beta-ketoacyl-[acyl-carrier-protein] synthase I n=1 Tax=Coniosporium apollinis TaxID=61459 RepID=A0ABQ9NL84_9PEZI|nr:hypothetical protein H2201_006911 [Coniosporium apollinis]
MGDVVRASTAATSVERRDMRSDAHQLLIELLVHQFAYPVRWIETQNCLFTQQDSISRFVELGPAKTLVGMAQKTCDMKMTMGELPLTSEVQFLASTQNRKELCYEYEATALQPDTSDEDQVAPPVDATAPSRADPPPVSISHPVPVAAASIADVSVSGEEIVRALVAQKLKKPIEQILTSKSIKELSGGKSTLQNELMGDLDDEFGAVPEAAEDLSLKALGAALSVGRELRLGKRSSNLISRLISSRMPPRFNLNSVRRYLAERWGLGPLRQSSVLLFAITTEPPARLPSVHAAEEYLDALAARYAESCSLVLQAQLPQAAAQTTATPVVDPAFLDEFSKGQKKMAAQQLKIFAEYLQVKPFHQTRSAELEVSCAELQEKLDLWHSEYSEEFVSGIKPCFDTKKSRRFDAWWNIVRQDVISLYHDAENGRLKEDESRLDELLHRIASRSEQPVLEMVESLTALSSERNGSEAGFSPIGRKLAKSVVSGIHQPPKTRYTLPVTGPQTRVTVNGSIEYKEVRRKGPNGSITYTELLRGGTIHGSRNDLPFVNLKSHRGGEWRADMEMTDILLNLFSDALERGVTFAGKDVLVTGAGPGSIGVEVVRGLLMGGAKVILTTSRAPSATSKYYQNLYESCGARGSELLILPCNQASARDCEALIDHIYSISGLGRDLDAIVPFAAVSEAGVEVDGIDAKSELAHRLMLVNVLRLLGRVIKNKKERHINCHPTQVLLPLSPNHGSFGGDGLYSESKLGLESLLNRFQSESWSEELTVCGVVIGWTRGTGLMSGNDIIAEAIEGHNVLTFSQHEMALNILILMTPTVVTLCENEPIVADFGAGLSRLKNLEKILSETRARLNSEVEIAKAVNEENDREEALSNSSKRVGSSAIKQRATLRVGFPSLPDYEKDLKPLKHLYEMVEPSSTVVVVGFSELGPWGSARTRWEIESQGKLSQAGYIEMAWLMNLIKHLDNDTKEGHYAGWADAKTGEHVHDCDIEARYGQQILDHSGIRLVEPELFGGYDPKKKEYLQEIVIEEDLPEFDATLATAQAYKLRHGDGVDIRQLDGTDECRVLIKRGAHILVPKAVPFTWGSVAGQLPTGWNPTKYGIQEDLLGQVDPATLYTLCCVSEALFSAGITDSLEIFKYIHLSEIGNFIGSSMGGASKTRALYKDIYLDKEIQSDVLQETYLNTTAAWVNMLLLGSAGPIKTPVGACATGVESIDSGYESIVSGKTRMCLVGGTDDFQEDESFGFSKMKATVNAAEELARGRLPSEMSRPTAETRAGFMEAQGCGIQIICSAELALEMGLPIYGIIASSTMAADKISRSVPAPGQGILTFARETPDVATSPLLDLDYRREQMQTQIHLWGDSSSQTLCSSGSSVSSSTPSTDSDLVIVTPPSLPPQLDAAVYHRIRAARKLWGNDFRVQNPNISPLRAALAVWGLTIDDIDVTSLHATSTKANDKNEPEVIDKQMTHLGRTAGRPLLAICQKSVTGHPKAPAAAWMLNGCLQVLDSGLVPGNRNADNVDVVLKKFEHLVFPTRPVKTTEVKAFLLTSFGFGQKGGMVVGVAPKYLFATLGQERFEEYAVKVTQRKRLANRAYVRALLSNKIVKAQIRPPYTETEGSTVFLNPLSRTSEDDTGALRFDSLNLCGVSGDECNLSKPSKSHKTANTSSDLALAANISKAWIEQQTRHRPKDFSTVGIDIVNFQGFTADENPVFIARNYTKDEVEFASKSLNPHAAFASRWCAKEAVFKSLRTPSKGAGAAMKDIEILSDGGIPKVVLHGDASAAAHKKGLQDIMLSLSHGDDSVIAIALGLSGDGPPTYTL